MKFVLSFKLYFISLGWCKLKEINVVRLSYMLDWIEKIAWAWLYKTWLQNINYVIKLVCIKLSLELDSIKLGSFKFVIIWDFISPGPFWVWVWSCQTFLMWLFNNQSLILSDLVDLKFSIVWAWFELICLLSLSIVWDLDYTTRLLYFFSRYFELDIIKLGCCK